MVKVNNNNITVTRGDNVTLNLAIDGYDFSGDTVTFGVKRDYQDKDCVLEKVVGADGKIEITSEDTAKLEAGAYVYDVKVVGAEVTQTVIAGAGFVVGQSVFA